MEHKENELKLTSFSRWSGHFNPETGIVEIPLKAQEETNNEPTKILAKLSLYKLRIQLSGLPMLQDVQNSFLILLENGIRVAMRQIGHEAQQEEEKLFIDFRDIFPQRCYSLLWSDENGMVRGALFQNVLGKHLKNMLRVDEEKGDFVLFDTIKLELSKTESPLSGTIDCVLSFRNGLQKRVQSQVNEPILLSSVPPGRVYVSLLGIRPTTSKVEILSSTNPPKRNQQAEQESLVCESWLKQIQQIIAVESDVIRNLKITISYYEFSIAMRELLGENSGANWPTWATWASKQVGKTIRQEDLPGLKRLVDEKANISELAGIAQAYMNQVSKTLASGNRKLFADIAPEFVRFLCAFYLQSLPTQTSRDSALQQYLQGFSSGRENLKSAFHHYFDAMFETNANRKHELMLLANTKIGMHEQTVIQPEIKQAMGFWGKSITEYMVQITLPGEALSVGKDIPPLSTEFPPTLRTIENPQLLKVIQDFDSLPDSLRNSGVNDWTVWRERMGYILDLFRSRHTEPSLFDAPFSQDQMESIIKGEIPPDPL